mmetsp:Transcript_6400/g.15849  ORF Transcript_6400/g.15849 Transcript_6400/m.15849 type:complete len:470 (+) Transcript_6400:219-1628(+)
MTEMTAGRSFRKRRISCLLASALFSAPFFHLGQTTLAFTRTTRRTQPPPLSPSSSSLSVSSSTFIRSEANVSPNSTIQYRRHDNRKHDGNPSDNWLKDLGLPRGLRNTLLDNVQEVSSKRIWIVDNSGSMKMMDGHEILEQSDCNKKRNKQKGNIQNNDSEKVLVPRASVTNAAADGDTTRWAELQETVACHAQLLSILGAPTDFRLLNPPSNGGPQKFRVGYYNNNNIQMLPQIPSIFRRRNQSESNRAEKIMSRNEPKGKTPLHKAIVDVRKDVIRMLPQLHADGMKVTIVICTDGCPNDVNGNGGKNQELEEALESLKGLPVNIVIRLCTDYGEVVDFYNDLDQRMGESSFLDVIDDYEAEAAQVYGQNPWLNYALVLHRMRELGLQGSSGLLDFLDQRPFTGDEIRDFVAMLFGTTSDLLPDPLCDWENFVGEIDRLQKGEQMHWNPAKMTITPWIDTQLLLALQ